jgi:hypothetical protein
MDLQTSFNRRDFLKLWGLSLGSFIPHSIRKWLPDEENLAPLGTGRITIRSIGLFEDPNFASPRLKWLGRDQLVSVIAEVYSPHGPPRNPRWYRLVGGYAHSAYLQRVETAHLNQKAPMIPHGGQLGEITVPYSQSMRRSSPDHWQPAYRLYFGAIFWITGFIKGPDGESWYEITDDRLGVKYCVPISHVRLISRSELEPISPRVPDDEKRILLSPVSTGIHSIGPTPNGIPTDTPTGNFHIARKTPSRHMGDGNLTSDLEAYELPGVPWVSFFHSAGIGFHGTYWHDNFGSQMSHGCVNMRNEDARWLYRWTSPAIQHSEWYKLGRGTRVQVI